MKQKPKEVNFLRENYRRLRKIFLHIIHGRFHDAFRLINHYNPVYRRVSRSPNYIRRKQKKNFIDVLNEVYSYSPDAGRQKKYNVALVIRDGNHSPTSSAFIRLISPLLDKSIEDEVQLKILSAQNMPDRINEDFAIVQRTAFDNIQDAEKFVDSCQKNTKIIIDNDDAFHKIDKSHPEYYQQVKRIEAVEYLMEKSAQIWVSTDQLVIDEHSKKTKIIPNTLDLKLWENKKPAKESSGPIKMVYMGTATHNADFELILPALDDLARKYPDSFKLTIIGVSRDLPNRNWISQPSTPRFGSLYPTFVKWFVRQGPFDIGLSPLVDSEFNRAKSDIKCLDYIAAGILPVVSDVRPYRSKDIENFIFKTNNSKQDWIKVLSAIISEPAEFRTQKHKIIIEGQKYLWKERSSEITARKLLDIFEKMQRSS